MRNMNDRNFVVREIAYKKDSGCIAVSLDLDIVAEGDTMGETIDHLQEATIGYFAISF